MPSANTFSIKPIAELLDRWLAGREVIIDPFARNSKRGTITNDLNPDTSADYHLDAPDFLKTVRSRGVVADAAIFDPPYSLEQVKRSYNDIGRKMRLEDGWLPGRWTDARDALHELLRPAGVVINCGWNSTGMCKNRGYEIREILLVCHGTGHNDTIVTVEEKVSA